MQPKREPRPKKPRIERPAAERPAYADYEEDDDDDPLAFEDDAADEDFDLNDEVSWLCLAGWCMLLSMVLLLHVPCLVTAQAV